MTFRSFHGLSTRKFHRRGSTIDEHYRKRFRPAPVSERESERASKRLARDLEWTLAREKILAVCGEKQHPSNLPFYGARRRDGGIVAKAISRRHTRLRFLPPT